MTSTNPALNDAEQQALQRATDAVRRHTAPRLAALQGDEAVVHFITVLHQGVDAVAQNAAQQGVRTACVAGCAHCCQVRVEVTPAEVFLIVRALQSPTAVEPTRHGPLPGLLPRLQAHAAALARLGPNAAWKERPSCPFLLDNLCSIYSVRPAVCRKGQSLDVAPCAAFAADIPQSLQVVVAAQAWIAGTALAYADQGLAATRHELGAAVLHALTDVTAEARWLEGDAIADAGGDLAP